jgi:hypothetical protein
MLAEVSRQLGPRGDVQCPAYSLTIGKGNARERAYAERDAEIIRGSQSLAYPPMCRPTWRSRLPIEVYVPTLSGCRWGRWRQAPHAPPGLPPLSTRTCIKPLRAGPDFHEAKCARWMRTGKLISVIYGSVEISRLDMVAQCDPAVIAKAVVSEQSHILLPGIPRAPRGIRMRRWYLAT